MPELNGAGEVRAAGGVPCRQTPAGDLEVLLVHRPAYDDWTIPKGKVEGDESDEACAVREVEEETGLRCRLGAELATVRWTDRFGRPKVARYWRMTVEDGAVARASHEVDEVVWLPVDAARARLTYPRDAEVLAALGAGDETGVA